MVVRFTEAEIAFLNSHNLLRIATISEEGWPHVIPMFYRFDGEIIYIGTALRESRKIKNIKTNNKVAIVVDELGEKSKQRGIMIEGQAEIQERRGFISVQIKPLKKTSWGVST